MKYVGTVLAVADVHAARAFYEGLFGLEVYQDYGIHVSFTCGLSLQQEFDWLVQLPKEQIVQRPNNVELMSLIHITEHTRHTQISYAVICL